MELLEGMLSNPFFVRGLIGGMIIAVFAPIIGSYMVMRRAALLGDTLAHVALVGIVIAIILQFQPLIVTMVVTVIAALLLERVQKGRFQTTDSSLVLFISGGLALSLLLSRLFPVAAFDLESFLFGNIVTITWFEIGLGALIMFCGLIVVWLFFDQIFLVSYDPEYAQVNGIRSGYINTLFSVVTAVVITFSLKMLGALLVSAFFIIPVLAVMLKASSFRQILTYSSILSFIGVLAGMTVAYVLNVPVSATIVLLLITVYIFMV